MTEQNINKIDPTPKNKCTNCGGKILVMMGVMVCEDCDVAIDLYEKKSKRILFSGSRTPGSYK